MRALAVHPALLVWASVASGVSTRIGDNHHMRLATVRAILQDDGYAPELIALDVEAMIVRADMRSITGLSADEVIDARDWLRDLVWANMEDEDFDALTHREIERAIERYFAGGIEGFRAAGGSL